MNNLRNSVRLVGFIGKDPEVTRFDNGKMKARLVIATQESYKDPQGEKQTHTQWHNVIVWGGRAAFAEQYLSKGNQVAVEGKLMYRNYEDKNGKRQFITEISANEIQMLDRINEAKAAS